MSIDLLSEAFLNRISENLFVDYSTILGLLRWKTSLFFLMEDNLTFINMNEDPSFSKMGDSLVFFKNGRQF
jgi:hypothetical protein